MATEGSDDAPPAQEGLHCPSAYSIKLHLFLVQCSNQPLQRQVRMGVNFLNSTDRKGAWITDVVPPKARSSIKAMRPARQDHELPAGLEFLRRT
jgi:hypothetical protein